MRSAVSSSAPPVAFRPRPRGAAPHSAPPRESVAAAPRVDAPKPKRAPSTPPITVGQTLRIGLILLFSFGIAQLSHPGRSQAEGNSTVFAGAR